MKILQMPISPATESRIAGLFQEGVGFETTGQLVKAAECYEQVLKLDPKHVSALINLGTVTYNRRDYAGAMTLYRKAVKIDPKYALGWYNLANALDEVKKFPEAIKALEKAIRLKPNYPDAIYNLAVCLQHVGKHRRALRYWAAYLKLDSAGVYADHARTQIKKTLSVDRLSIVYRRAA